MLLPLILSFWCGIYKISTKCLVLMGFDILQSESVASERNRAQKLVKVANIADLEILTHRAIIHHKYIWNGDSW